MTNRIPNTASWQERVGLKEPGSDYEFKQVVTEYLDKFVYKQTVKLGPTHGQKFKDFSCWCHEHLGVKFKDWFLFPAGRDTYTLFCRSDKWAIFLALTWFDVIA